MAPARRNSPRRRPSPVAATAHVDLEYPSSVPTFTVNPTQLSSSSTPLPWFSAFGRADNEAPLPNAIDPKYSDPAYYASSSAYGKNGRNSSHTAKKPAGHIKRPPNCFLLFRSHVKESNIRIPDELKPLIKQRLTEKKKQDRLKNGGQPHGDDDESDSDDDDENDDDEQSVSKISGILWDFLPPKEKSFFRARAAHAKAQHKRLFPDYKYSPQAKDKNVKKRTGKKMAVEKKQRLEEVAGVLVQNLGWASNKVKEASSSSVKQEQHHHQQHHQQIPRPISPGATNVPGTGAFAVPQYEHQPPAFAGHNSSGSASSKPRSVPSTPAPVQHDAYGVPMSLGGPNVNNFQQSYAFPPPLVPSTSAGPMSAFDPSSSHSHIPHASEPRMQRRTSSCPPPNAHLTWDSSNIGAAGLPLPHVYGQASQHFVSGQPLPAPTVNNWGTYANPQFDGGFASPAPSSSHHQPTPPLPAPFPHAQQQHPINGVYVRPGGKTLRKMRTGAPTAKAQLLNGSGKKGGASSRKQAEIAPAPTSGMMLPSLPTVMKNIAPAPAPVPQRQRTQQELMSTMVPMSTTGAQDDASSWTAFSNYDLMGSNSQHSSPATFSTSTAPSILETPPVGQQLPQLAYAPQFDLSSTVAGQQQQPFSNSGYNADQFGSDVDAYGAAVLTPKANDENRDGDLGLTIVDPAYTFPPPAPSPANMGSPATVRASSPTKPQRTTSNKWTKPQASKNPYPTSGRKVPRLQMASANADPSSNADSPSSAYPNASTPSAFPPTPSSALSPPSLVSPIPLYVHQQPMQQQMGLEDLGVELSLNLPPGVDVGQMDPEHLGGLLEYASFQQGHDYMNTLSRGLLQDGYSLGLSSGAQAGNALLGDVALGVHEDDQQQFLGQDGGYEVSPLDVPLEAGIYENGGAVPFDPSMFVNDPNVPLGTDEEVNLSAATAEEMAASNNLEFQLMEWRRSSGSGQGQTQGPDMGRRASISTGPSLYGFHPDQGAQAAAQGYNNQDAPTPRNYEITQNQPAAQHVAAGMNVGWEFEFEPQQLQDFATTSTAQDPNNNYGGAAAGYVDQHAGSYAGQFYQQNFYPPPPAPHQLNLETVQERSSSEEADERRFRDTWVSSSA